MTYLPTSEQHRKAASQLLDYAQTAVQEISRLSSWNPAARQRWAAETAIASAQVHATLAVAAASGSSQ